MNTLPFDDRDGFIWYNGEMVPWREAQVHILCHGLHYASSVFEGERSYNGKVFKLREHSARLIRSAEILDMKIPLSVEEIDEITKEVVKANNVEHGYVRPVAWRGSEQMAISAPNSTIHVAIAAWDWGKYFKPKAGAEKGIALMTSEWRRPDPRTVPVQAKAAGVYMIGTMAKHVADRSGYDDVLMLDYKGRVAESSGANLFVVQDGVLKTPDPECFLNGITRQTILGLADDLGIPNEVTTLMPEDLANVQEIFVTGTAAEVTPVGKIDNREYEIGPITKKLKDAYTDLVNA